MPTDKQHFILQNENENSTARNISSNLIFLDGLRGIASAVVMIGHARWLLWEGFSEGYLKHPETYSSLEKVFVYLLSVFRYGHQSVLFFFILSGFVIHLRYARIITRTPEVSFDYWDYFKRRIRRIYPPFLFIIFFTWIIDLWGMNLGFSIYLGQTPNQLINNNISTDHSFSNLLGNLFFLQNESVGTWGTNGPLWSLKYEWWFYVLYPFLFLINRKTVYGAGLLILLLFAVGSLLHISSFVFFMSVLQLLLFWWLGVLLSDIYTKRINISHLQLAPLVIMLPVMVLIEKHIHNDLLSDTGWALGFFGLLNLLFYLMNKGIVLTPLNKLKWLGDCSYTLYIVHFPILVFLNGLILSYTKNVMPHSMLFVLVAVPLIILIAYGLHFFIEVPFLNKKNRSGSTI